MTDQSPNTVRHASNNLSIGQTILSAGCLDSSLLAAAVDASDPEVERRPNGKGDGHHAPLVRVALIDALRFSRDCLVRAFRALNQGLSVIPFPSIDECVRAYSGTIDVIPYCAHDDGMFEDMTLQHVLALLAKFDDVPVVVLSDAREAHGSREYSPSLALWGPRVRSDYHN